MNRICLLFLFFGSLFGTSVSAQDFTVDDLIKLRGSNLSVFETIVMSKGYEIADVSSGYDRFVSFKKDDRTIAFGYMRNDHSQAIDTVVIFRTRDIAEYKALQKQKTEDPAHPNLTHFISDDSRVFHMYIDGNVCLHFRTMRSYGTTYEVKAMPDNTDKYFHYSSLNGNIDY